MDQKDKVILVLGATGQQGGEVTKQSGAKIFTENMEDIHSMESAMRGVYGVFSVQPPEWNPTALSDAYEIKSYLLSADG